MWTRRPRDCNPWDCNANLGELSEKLVTPRNPMQGHEVTNDAGFGMLPSASGYLAPTLAENQQTPLPAPIARIKYANRRPPRIRRGTAGLPEDHHLLALVEVYLKTQRQLWPELAAAGVLPEVTPEYTQRMLTEFKSTFMERKLASLDHLKMAGFWRGLGIAYGRYSSDDQNPKSLDDQLHLQLQRARRDNVFIPWSRVFADAGVSGLSNKRAGYSLAKAALTGQGAELVTTIYIDEVSRASRVDIEVLQLGHLVQSEDNRARALALLQETAQLLEQDVLVAAAVLRQLLGKVLVRSVRTPSDKRPRWVAKIRGDLVPLLASKAQSKDCPDSLSWLKLLERKWTFPVEAEISLGTPPRYEAIAEKAAELHQEGLSHREIGAVLGTNRTTAADAVRFAQTGQRPAPKRRVVKIN